MPKQKLKKGDVREDGMRFWVYKKRGRKRDGAEYEIWLTEEIYQERQSSLADWRETNYVKKDGVKRLNPDTGDYFKLGDARPSSDTQDGKRFSSYRAKRYKDKNGYRLENWYDEAQFEALRNSNRASSRRGAEVRKQEYLSGKIEKRLNSDNGLLFKKGDKRPKSDPQDGKLFWSYVAQSRTSDNYIYERWYDEQDWHYRHIYSTMMRMRRRAKKEGLPATVTEQYLLDIFPQDKKCPILQLELVWGGEHPDNNPSLDKIKPELGYVEGNVAWMSSRANRIKYNATKNEIIALADWMRAHF